MNYSRRRILLAASTFLATHPFRHLLADDKLPGLTAGSNFHYVYDNSGYKREFKDFLANVFRLYPEDKMHALISTVTQESFSDAVIYKELQEELDDIKPFLADLTYSLPALRKQKKVIAKQTAQLLDSKERYDGYLEIGSTGRYLDTLEDKIKIRGERYYLSDLKPSYSIVDIIDRGQLLKGAEFIALNNYQSGLAKAIPINSLDLVSVYIGLHHCPLDLREEFITSIRDSMKSGASLILRDHNVHNEKMWKMVALAHDVFNMGTKESWDYNNRELRLFYSLTELDEILVKFGFKSDGQQLYQEGDPTLNALMHYKKV
ncbi:MAG: dehydrogenase [Porticoccaceae bacterium]|nr:MAG: dehydrogenase [Porticoccaceae bacterium]